MVQLRQHLPEDITWQNVLGGLAPDNDQPMPDHTRQMVQDHWRTIQASIDTEFNFDFWEKCQPRRDTYKACRAVIAASRQQAEEAMIEAIQKAYYPRAMNPSEPETLADIASELGLDRVMFVEDLASEQTETEFRRQLLLRAKLYVRSFPSLVLEKGISHSLIKHDYHDYQVSLRQIWNCLDRGAGK
jgi:putative protein-disulfide isomerase